MRALPRFLKPGGRLCYNFYERDLWPYLQGVKYALRCITRHLPIKATLALSAALVKALFPLTRALSRIRYLRILNVAIPIASVHDPQLTRDQQFAWSFLDTFDWYGPRYEIRQNHRRVQALLKELGLRDVTGSPGLARGRKPA